MFSLNIFKALLVSKNIHPDIC